jgi:hypothetical protein
MIVKNSKCFFVATVFEIEKIAILGDTGCILYNKLNII